MAAIPVGDDLCVGTTNGNTLPTGFSFPGSVREITFGSSTGITSGSTYAVVIRISSEKGIGDALRMGQDTSDQYPGGLKCISSDNGGSWATSVTRELFFDTQASGVSKDKYFPATTPDAEQFCYGDFWIAQTFTASSSYAITSVILKLRREGTSFPGTITVSIKEASDVPIKANTPIPATTATDVTLDQATLAWTDGGNSDTYNVYYGPTSGSLPLVSSAQAGTSFSLSTYLPLAYGVTRYWRIDSINDAGTTTGDEWSFTTISLNSPVDIVTVGRLVAAANNKIWYESI
ncbi:hypothetical protein LCGC14_1230230 [marine sediment metagenome]|uniref:Fibronectin type-III domain-containing protein n=1 Tax=marine sediment metagenome TaxID=412755 RepID=A0A0F9LVZ4_9ZZZZ